MGASDSRQEVEYKIHSAISLLFQSPSVSKKTKYQVKKWAAIEYKESPERNHLALPYIPPPTDDYLEVDIDEETFDCSASCLIKFSKMTFVLDSKVAHVKLYQDEKSSTYSLLLEAQHNDCVAKVLITRETKSSEIQIKLKNKSFEMSGTTKLVKESKCPKSTFSNVLEWLHNNKKDLSGGMENEKLFDDMYQHLMKGSIVLIKSDSKKTCQKSDMKNDSIVGVVKDSIRKRVLIKTENESCLSIQIKNGTLQIEYLRDCTEFNKVCANSNFNDKRDHINRTFDDFFDWLQEFDEGIKDASSIDFHEMFFDFIANESFLYRSRKNGNSKFKEVKKSELKEAIKESKLKQIMRDKRILYLQRFESNDFISIEIKSDGVYVTSDIPLDEVSPDTKEFDSRIKFPSGSIHDCFNWLQSHKRNEISRKAEQSHDYLERLMTERCATSFIRIAEEISPKQVAFGSIFLSMLLLFLFPQILAFLFYVISIVLVLTIIVVVGGGAVAHYHQRDDLIYDIWGKVLPYLRSGFETLRRLIQNFTT